MSSTLENRKNSGTNFCLWKTVRTQGNGSPERQYSGNLFIVEDCTQYGGIFMNMVFHRNLSPMKIIWSAVSSKNTKSSYIIGVIGNCFNGGNIPFKLNDAQVTKNSTCIILRKYVLCFIKFHLTYVDC